MQVRFDRSYWSVMGFPRKSGKKLPANVGDTDSICGSGRSHEEGNGNPPTPVFLPGESHGQRRLMAVGSQSARLDRVTEQQ